MPLFLGFSESYLILNVLVRERTKKKGIVEKRKTKIRFFKFFFK